MLLLAFELGDPGALGVLAGVTSAAGTSEVFDHGQGHTRTARD